jgi:hypothetical protein
MQSQPKSMKNDEELKDEEQFFVLAGPAYRLETRLGLHLPTTSRRVLKVVLLLLLTWVPIVVLSLIAGHAFPGSVKVPFLRDPETNGRLLVALPLLELAFVLVHISLAVQARSFVEMGLIPARQRSDFIAAKAAALRWRESYLGEGILVFVAYAAAIGSRLYFDFGTGDSSWERVGQSLTPAGWWHTLVSLPFLYFLILRWAWVIVCWSRFLHRVSRLDLQLTATHPDRVGGLGFLAWGVAAFAPLLTAMSAMVAAGMADEMYHQGVLLKDLKYDVFGYVAVAILIVYIPLLFFLLALSRCKFRGLLDFGKLVWDHDRAFEKKWLEEGADHRQDLVGSPDISSLADAGLVYEHVNEMWFFPFDLKAFASLVIAAMVPFAVLLPIKEFILSFGELLI